MAATDSVQVTIRECQAVDLPDVFAVAQRSFRLPYSQDTLVTYLQRARGGFLVAEVEGKIAGFVVATSPVVTILGGRTGEIALVAVDEPYRRAGIGRRLMRAGMELLRNRGMRWVRLHVETGNHAAISLYQKLGFAVERVVPGYYRDGTDAFQMICCLEEV